MRHFANGSLATILVLHSVNVHVMAVVLFHVDTHPKRLEVENIEALIRLGHTAIRELQHILKEGIDAITGTASTQDSRCHDGGG